MVLLYNIDEIVGFMILYCRQLFLGGIDMASSFDIKGSMVALITPFNEDKSINYDKLEELLEFHIANKTDCVLILGTTSESPTFTWEEDYEIVKRSVEVCKGRMPLVANAGSNDTRT